MSKHLILLAAFGLLAVGCEQTEPTTPGGLDVTPQANTGPAVHRATLGGADICEALGAPTGCDANFSLVANAFADGSVKGQWQDTFGQGQGGVHVEVDCLAVYGNQAVVGGVITKASGFAAGAEGLRAITSVVDNGTSKNDAADQLSFSIFPEDALFPVGENCDVDPAEFDPFLFDLTNGQAVVVN